MKAKIKQTENLTKNILTELYVDKRMTSYEIAEVLQISRKTVTRWLKEFGIDVNPKQRKFELIKKIPLNKEQRELTIGTLLGDGHLGMHGRKNKSGRLMIGHCEEQKDLVFWKKIVLGNLVNTINIRKDERKDRESTMYSFVTVVHNDFRFFRELFYEGNLKVIRDELINYLTPYAFAVWIMDDGSLNGRGANLRLHTDCFTKEENIKLQYMLKTNFDIRSKVCEYERDEKKYYYLSMNKENTIKASKLVEPYFVDCMKYKLNTDSSTTLRQTLSDKITDNDDKV